MIFSLHSDLLSTIINKLSFLSILNLSLTDKFFYNTILNNQEFWKKI